MTRKMQKQKIRITKEFRFEMAHALFCHDGLCKNIHGHSYTLSVTVIGYPVEDETQSDNGMIIDFGELKSIVNEQIINVFDHSLILHNSADKNLMNELTANFEKVYLVDYHPTSENLLVDYADRIKDKLPESANLHSLILRETATSVAEWHAADNV
jgi:6-pyruvoyltetrahydropterin/6-carboxytetrahydropterin synthase